MLPARRWRRSRRRIAIGAIVAIAVADVVLIGALWHAQHTVGSGAGSPVSAPRTSASEHPAPTTSQSASARASESGDEVVDRALLAVVDEVRAVRGTSSRTCAAGNEPKIEMTDSGGETWQPVPLPTEVVLVNVQRLASTSSGLLLVGGDEACQLHLFAGAADGTAWTLLDVNLPDAWYITAHGAVNAPGGRVTEPCKPVMLAARGTASGSVVCNDDAVFLTTDGGVTWTPTRVRIDPQEGAALTPVSGGFVVADRDSSCPEVRVRAFREDGTLLADQSCVAGDGALALSTRGDEVWLSSDSGLKTSRDGGKTW